MARTKRKSTIEKLVARGKKPNPSKLFRTVGVRFLQGDRLYQVYTYQIRLGAKIHLGQELIADTPRGPSIAVIVRIDATYNPEKYEDEIKTITRWAAPL